MRTVPDSPIWALRAKNQSSKSQFSDSLLAFVSPNLNDFPRLDLLEGQSKGRKVLPEVFKAVGGRLENLNGESLRPAKFC
jgi:hypothetical protein